MNGKRRIRRTATQQEPFDAQQRMFKLLSGRTKDARLIRSWLEARLKEGDAGDVSRALSSHLFVLAGILETQQPPTDWDLAGTEKRERHLTRVRTLANELADLLTTSESLGDPRLIDLIDSDTRKSLVLNLTPEQRDALFPRYHSYVVPAEIGLQTTLSELLRTAAERFGPELAWKPAYMRRPGSGNLEVRELCERLKIYLRQSFNLGRNPNELIAACVRIRYPEHAGADAEKVRDWLAV